MSNIIEKGIYMKKIRYPFGTITITKKSKELVKEILDAGRVSGGKYVREFEKKFAGLVGTKEAVALSSGTDADALALAVLYDYGAQRNDEVIVPALSFAATGNAVLQAGFKPVFVDVERTTLNIDPAKIEKAITKKSRAIMPVHLMGKPADMNRSLRSPENINYMLSKTRLKRRARFTRGKIWVHRPYGSLQPVCRAYYFDY